MLMLFLCLSSLSFAFYFNKNYEFILPKNYFFYVACIFLFSIIKNFLHEKSCFVQKKCTSAKPAQTMTSTLSQTSV